MKKYNETSFIADHKNAPRRKLQGSEHFRFMDKDIKPHLSSHLGNSVAWLPKFSDVRVS